MDGNGRWAKTRNLPRLVGHQRGAQVLKEIVEACARMGVRYLTVYAFSSENWNRPGPEVRGLLGLLEYYLEREEKLFLQKNIRLRVIGERERLPLSLRERIERVEAVSALKTQLLFQVAFGYGSRAEMTRAARLIAEDVKAGRLTSEEITEACFSNYLYTTGVPDPDLLIRTSGEQRISNYLLWQLAYTELVFNPKYWPDFTIEDLTQAFQLYGKRERRFGLAS